MNDVRVFDPHTKEWLKHPRVAGSCPSARSNHAATTMDDTLYVHGGGSGSSSRAGRDKLADLFAFYRRTCRSWAGPPPTYSRSRDRITVPESDNASVWQWSEPDVFGTPPAPRNSHAMCQVAPKTLLLFGGHDGDYDLGDTHALAVREPARVASWMAVVTPDAAPCARRFHCMAYIASVGA